MIGQANDLKKRFSPWSHNWYIRNFPHLRMTHSKSKNNKFERRKKKQIKKKKQIESISVDRTSHEEDIISSPSLNKQSKNRTSKVFEVRKSTKPHLIQIQFRFLRI